MTNDIFIGVDGGATAAKIRVEDHTGQVLGQSVSGPANIRFSTEKAWKAIYDGLEEALKSSHIALKDPNYRFHIGLGLAGCEDSEAVHEFLACPHPFSNIQLVSDAHIACVGAHQGKDGAIIVIGTGVVGYKIEKNKSTRAGGWGFPHDDEGGGAWLGLEAARLTFQWLDNRIEKSLLAEEVFAFFNHDMDRFAMWAGRANSSEFARLAPLVINHMQQEEVQSVRLIKKAAHAVDRIGIALMKSQEEPETKLACSLSGGIAPFIEPWLCEELRDCLVARHGDASSGAILMIREQVAKTS